MKKIAFKGFLAVMGIMFFFTMVSRIASSFTVARVNVEAPLAKKIEHIVEADGRVEQNRELAVLTQPEILVKTVYVSEGETVKQGDVLAELDIEYLQEHREKIQNEIRILELQNESAVENENAAKENKQRVITRAKEDYDRTLQENNAAFQKALAKLKEAKQSLESYEKQQSEQKEKKEQGKNTMAVLEGLQEEVKQAQEAYDETITAYHQAMLEAERKIEDAENAEISVDYNVEINNISIEEKRKQLKKLEELQQEEGKILAPLEGVVTKSYLMAGQKTTDSACFTMADVSAGMRYVAEISKEELKYVQIGDEVTLEVTGKSVKDLRVASIETKEENENFLVTVLLPKGTLSIGDSAGFKVVKQSKTYETTVPVTAIHRENNKEYVYVAAETETVLGREIRVREVEVTVLEKNNQYVALQEGVLNSETKVITDSDRYIEAGRRVRLQNL